MMIKFGHEKRPRTMNSEGTARRKGDHQWVQPIIVSKGGRHEETIRLGSIASVQVGLAKNNRPQDVIAFEQWLSGPFTKSVRRASPEQITKVIEWCDDEGMIYSNVAECESAAISLPPMLYEEIPKVISRLQVSGTEFSRGSPASDEADFKHIQISVLENLTTGKATAQAAHALWKWILQADNDDVLSWENKTKDFIKISLTNKVNLKNLANQHPAAAVWDNGLTETEANTLTAIAIQRLNQ